MSPGPVSHPRNPAGARIRALLAIAGVALAFAVFLGGILNGCP